MVSDLLSAAPCASQAPWIAHEAPTLIYRLLKDAAGAVVTHERQGFFELERSRYAVLSYRVQYAEGTIN